MAQKLNLGFGAILNFFSVKTVILNCVIIAVNKWFMIVLYMRVVALGVNSTSASMIFFVVVFDYVLAGTTILNSWSHLVFFLLRLEQERVFQLYRQCGGQSQCRKVSKIELLLLVEFIDHRCLC